MAPALWDTADRPDHTMMKLWEDFVILGYSVQSLTSHQRNSGEKAESSTHDGVLTCEVFERRV